MWLKTISPVSYMGCLNQIEALIGRSGFPHFYFLTWCVFEGTLIWRELLIKASLYEIVKMYSLSYAPYFNSFNFFCLLKLCLYRKRIFSVLTIEFPDFVRESEVVSLLITSHLFHIIPVLGNSKPEFAVRRCRFEVGY